MATNTLKEAAKVVLGAAETTIYTVPASTTAVVTLLNVANRDTALRKFTIFSKPGAGAAVAADTIALDEDLDPKARVPLLRGKVLPAGAVLSGQADAANVVVANLSVVEISA